MNDKNGTQNKNGDEDRLQITFKKHSGDGISRVAMKENHEVTRGSQQGNRRSQDCSGETEFIDQGETQHYVQNNPEHGTAHARLHVSASGKDEESGTGRKVRKLTMTKTLKGRATVVSTVPSHSSTKR